ncbi:hypothetical protein EJ05DRAFT_484784 [Pseudovirgaria hyperparasitica]|uniref:Uncharacterized protein n=1 Tax=Pseudovirgaria hyperparasitica TaxID=470096 RepID=A0A6A6WCI4_9PEZI|nr:uncharacterized protein EJ05DRAFT_484784 [Pseudovirgaria hyperparasitica]KAF2759889.1 hypothetical protein EJ05DRAFT_484784 [Pseudovirgaria hyperparasitica]
MTALKPPAPLMVSATRPAQKTFNFQKLALELKYEIYEYLLLPSKDAVFLKDHFKPRKSLEQDSLKVDVNNEHHFEIAILLVSREVYSEALPILQKNLFAFTDLTLRRISLPRWKARSTKSNRFESLANIKNLKLWLRVPGLRLEEVSSIIPYMPSLQSLTIGLYLHKDRFVTDCHIEAKKAMFNDPRIDGKKCPQLGLYELTGLLSKRVTVRIANSSPNSSPNSTESLDDEFRLVTSAKCYNWQRFNLKMLESFDPALADYLAEQYNRKGEITDQKEMTSDIESDRPIKDNGKSAISLLHDRIKLAKIDHIS